MLRGVGLTCSHLSLRWAEGWETHADMRHDERVGPHMMSRCAFGQRRGRAGLQMWPCERDRGLFGPHTVASHVHMCVSPAPESS